MATATCRTEGCLSNGVGVEVTLTLTDFDTGETVAVGAVACGSCGQQITDITDAS